MTFIGSHNSQPILWVLRKYCKNLLLSGRPSLAAYSGWLKEHQTKTHIRLHKIYTYCTLFTQIFDWLPALDHGKVSARPQSGPMVKQYTMISHKFKPKRFIVHLETILIAVLHIHYKWLRLNTLQYWWLNAFTLYSILISFNTYRSPYFKHNENQFYSHGY